MRRVATAYWAGPAWWRVATVGAFLWGVVLMVGARPAGMDRQITTGFALCLSVATVFPLVVALLGRRAFMAAAALELLVLLRLVTGGFWLALAPLVTLLAALPLAIRGGRPPIRSALIAICSIALPYVAAILVAAPTRYLWACFDDSDRQTRGAVSDALSPPVRGGETAHRPYISDWKVINGGIEVELDPYIDDAHLTEIKRRLLRVPGVKVQHSRACSPATPNSLRKPRHG